MLFRCHSPTFSSMFPFPNRDASVHRDWPADVRYVAAKDGARIAEKGELRVALGNDRPLRSSYTMRTKFAISDAFVRDCAVALLRFCGLQTPQKRNGLFTLAWHRTEFDRLSRVITARQFENSDIRFSSLTSQHYFNINGNLKR